MIQESHTVLRMAIMYFLFTWGDIPIKSSLSRAWWSSRNHDQHLRHLLGRNYDKKTRINFYSYREFWCKVSTFTYTILSIYIYAGADSDFCGPAQPAIKSSQRLKDFALRPGGRSTHEDTLPEQALMRSDAKSSEWFCSFKFYLYNLIYYILSYTSIPCFRSESLSSLRMCPYHHMEEICVFKSMHNAVESATLSVTRGESVGQWCHFAHAQNPTKNIGPTTLTNTN